MALYNTKVVREEKNSVVGQGSTTKVRNTAAGFVFFGGRLGFWQKKGFNAPRATDL